MGELAHVSVRTTVRPPRAVILFRGDENWRRWARLALLAASNTWAGGGHLLVPYDATGDVSERMLEAARHFDPDHILQLTPTLREWEWLAPGTFRFTDPSGRPPPADDVAKMLAGYAGTQTREDPIGERARKLLEGWCSPFFEPGLGEREDGPRLQHQSTIETSGTSGLVKAAQIFPDTMPPHVAVPRHWESDTALVLGGLWGVVESDDARAEPPVRTMLRDALRSSMQRQVVDDLWAIGPGPVAAARFDILDSDVASFSSGRPAHHGAVVIGDSVEDFAYAQACRTLLGFGLWLPTGLLEDDEVLRGAIAPMVMDVFSPYRDRRRLPRFVSASLEDGVLDAYLARLDELVTGPFIDPPPRNRVGRTAPADLAYSYHLRAYPEEVGVPSAVAVERDGGGNSTMTTPFVLPSPSGEGYFGEVLPQWVVDVSFDESAVPTGRSIGPDALVVPTTGFQDSIVRSGRDGLAVLAGSFGFVQAGVTKVNRQARPRLISTGMRSWVGAMALERGLNLRRSSAGNNAEIVARRLGSRAALIDLVSGPMHPALTLFAATDESGKKRKERFAAMDPGERALQPVWIGDVAYATVASMRHAARASDETAIVEFVDQLVEADLVQRGLILLCDDCGRRSFVSVDRIGRRSECPRCGAPIMLTSLSWRTGSEPIWHFDLHAAFRQLLSEHGDVPLLAAARLRAGARRYADIGEVEFHRDGSPLAEIDLVAHIDGQVVAVEAKATGDLSEQKAGRKAKQTAAKIADAARTVRADRVVLATTKESWKVGDTALVESALAMRFEPYPAPTVETMNALAPGLLPVEEPPAAPRPEAG
ncbi:hypothetical protein ACH47X_16575 [Promicromonospora kroppenstedtii]|uniref:Uncharacterized protein n=1 Tax=Promicromonospora kroppenstedtii TaxID=440482 RepID=A0ABW7XLZ2_9MICO